MHARLCEAWDWVFAAPSQDGQAAFLSDLLSDTAVNIDNNLATHTICVAISTAIQGATLNGRWADYFSYYFVLCVHLPAPT